MPCWIWPTASAGRLIRVTRSAKSVRPRRPYVAERAISIYTMQQADFEARFYNEDYWARYFDMLARDRFNTFVLIFGYENAGYFAPAYP